MSVLDEGYYRNASCALNVKSTFANTTGVTNGAGTDYPSGAPQFTPVFSGVRVTRSLVLYVLLYFSFWLLCCLFFFDIRFDKWILIAPLVSSNSSLYHKILISITHSINV
jgi:hypothetical protein